MRAVSLLFRSMALKWSSKRVIPIGKSTVQVGLSSQHQPTLQQETRPVEASKIPWEAMDLEQLSKLDMRTIDAIKYELAKSKIGAHLNLTATQSPEAMSAPLKQTYGKLVELADQPEYKKGDLAELYDLNLVDNAQIKSLIQMVYSKLASPQSQLNFLQPAFIKYLVALNNDLSRFGLALQNHEVVVGQIKPIHIEYQFWVGVHRNRSRNHSEDNFIIYSKSIENPNNSLLLQSPENRKVQLKYIMIKRRPEKCFVGLIVKALLETTINGRRHHVKVEFEGPKSLNNRVVAAGEPNYRIIDIDFVMNGNPTIQPVFRFG